MKFRGDEVVINLEQGAIRNTPHSVIGGVLRQYFAESGVHGVKYIGNRRLHIGERIFWAVAVLLGIFFSVYLVQQIYRKFSDNPIIISFQPMEMSISKFPFPAITLCNVNLLRRTVLSDVLRETEQLFDNLVAETVKEEQNETRVKELLDTFFVGEQVAHYCLAAPSFRRRLNETLRDVEGNEDLISHLQNFLADLNKLYPSYSQDNVSMESRARVGYYARKGIISCSDMIVNCMWALKFVQCDELFRYVYTDHGLCCQFNMMPMSILRKEYKGSQLQTAPQETLEIWERFGMDDLILNKDNVAGDSLPVRQRFGGKQNGLTIKINPEVHEYSTCTSNDGWGFKMVAHSPISFPRVSEYSVAIPTNSETFVEIDPQVTTANLQSLGSIDIGKRGCYFPSDPQANLPNYKFYSAGNCLDECVAKYTFQNCSCVQHYMPKNQAHPTCVARQLKCSQEVRDNLMTEGNVGGKCSQCLPSCTDIKYKMQLSYFPLRHDNGTGDPDIYSTLETPTQRITNYSIVHIFIGTNTINVKERKRLFDFWDLLSNTGGLLGLTLGFSILSIVEIGYFFTFRAWFQLRKEAINHDLNDFKESGYSCVCSPANDKIFTKSNRANIDIRGFSFMNNNFN